MSPRHVPPRPRRGSIGFTLLLLLLRIGVAGGTPSAAMAQSPPSAAGNRVHPDIESWLNRLPAGRGTSAEIFRTADGIAAVAVASGRWSPEPGERRVPPPIARDRAIRAAAMLAKSEIAGRIRKSVEVESWLRESPDRSESGQVIVVTLGRTMLAGIHRWKVEAEPEESGWKARVWIWTVTPQDPAATSPEGLLRFETPAAAAEAIASLASEGLADLGTISVLVGPEGHDRPVTLGVAVGAGPEAERVALIKAEAEAVRARASTVEGRDRLERTETIEDPLSSSGSRSALSERLDRERGDRATGTYRRGGKAVRTAGDVTYVVVWPAE